MGSLKPMIIICDESRNKYFKQMFAVSYDGVSAPRFVNEPTVLEILVTGQVDVNTLIFVEANLEWFRGIKPGFAGVELACELRRNYLLRSPIVIISTFAKSDLSIPTSSEGNFDILKASGTGYIQIPFAPRNVISEIDELATLSESELNDVIQDHCDFWPAWRRSFHDLVNLVPESQKNSEQISLIFSKWKRPILRFWPQLGTAFADLEDTVLKSGPEVPIENQLKAFEAFDANMLEKQQIRKPKASSRPKPSRKGSKEAMSNAAPANALERVLPKCPPKGFSKVLIADDNLQLYLAETLRSEYRYDVIIPQATKLGQAKKMVDKHQPNVVLADLYFKESDRSTEVPDKAVGEEFIKYANRAVNNPLVLVTSKAIIRADELLRGTFNCSGAARATNAEEVHKAIWFAASTRGVNAPEDINGRSWGPDLVCRQRLEPYSQLLPQLIVQWSHFPVLIEETHSLSKLLVKTAIDDDKQLVEDLVEALQTLSGNADLSMGGVKQLFAKTDEIHRLAKLNPDSQTKTNIRNILHGKIEQFSAVRNAVDQMLKMIGEVAADLRSIPKFETLGNKLGSFRSAYSPNAPLAHFLGQFQPLIDAVLKKLPKLPTRQTAESRIIGDRQKLRIVVVEDNSYWESQVREAIARLKEIYRSQYEITQEVFDNVDDALSAVQPRLRTNAIAEIADRTPTLAILDICLPKDRQHADRIRSAASGKSKAFDSPESANGLDLIRKFSEYTYNLPIVVFSTIDSVSDRKKVCGWGVSESSFVSKGPDASEHLVRAVNRWIEKSNRYLISRHHSDQVGADEEEVAEVEKNPVFRINGIEIDFSPALFETFTSLFNLRQESGKKMFTFAEIIERQGMRTTDRAVKVLQDRMNRIRKKIFEIAHSNRIYIDIHEILRTCAHDENDSDYAYELNAEVSTFDDDVYDPRLEYLDELTSRNRILIAESNADSFSEIAEILEGKGYEVRFSCDDTETIRFARDFAPDVLIISVDAIEDPVAVYKSVCEVLTGQDIGILMTSEGEFNSEFANNAIQSGIRLENLISKSSPTWLNDSLQALENERLRVFVGDVPDLSNDVAFPIIEILDGTDFETGNLVLMVNGKPFSMKPRSNSVLPNLMAILIESPGETISWPVLKERLKKPPTRNTTKTWPQRLRDDIEEQWLDADGGLDIREQAMLVLESSADGLRLNVRTIDLRTIE